MSWFIEPHYKIQRWRRRGMGAVDSARKGKKTGTREWKFWGGR